MKVNKFMKNKEKYEVLHRIILLLKPMVILGILGFGYLIFFQKFGKGIPCLIYELTGYRCPGCGMTHALAEVWNGNYAGAWKYNALSITVLPVMCIYLLYRSIREQLGKNDGFYIWEYILLAILFIIVFLYGYVRNFI